MIGFYNLILNKGIRKVHMTGASTVVTLPHVVKMGNLESQHTFHDSLYSSQLPLYVLYPYGFQVRGMWKCCLVCKACEKRLTYHTSESISLAKKHSISENYLSWCDSEVYIDFRIEGLISKEVRMQVLTLLHVCFHVKVHPASQQAAMSKPYKQDLKKQQQGIDMCQLTCKDQVL